MPPSGFTPNAVKGSLLFIRTCYEDLLAEVRSGKHASFEAAIEYELGQIEKALSKLHIDTEGNLVQR
jgi:hypothetical protein